MAARLLLICRHDYWPSLTPERVWALPYDQWELLALAVDKIRADREKAEDDMREQMRKR